MTAPKQKPKSKRGGKRLNAGRKKGSLNKANREIRDIIDSSCDLEKVIQLIATKALHGNLKCARLLLEYRYGKPTQQIIGDPNHPLEHTVRVIFDEPE